MELHLLHLLLLCVLVTAADGNSPVVVKEDSDVVLPCSLSSKENLESKLFDWKKDQNMEVFIYAAGTIYGNKHTERTGQDQQFKGRVSHFPDELKKGNASIKITKTKVSDSGTYTCIFPSDDSSGSIRQEFSVQLVVVACPKPSAKQIKVTNEHAVLQCVVQGASPKPVVEWRDSSGNILPAEEPKVTEREGRFDIILRTTVYNNDNYTCVVTQKEICHEVPDDILVHLPGPAPEPSGFSVGWIVAGILLLVVLVVVVLAATGRLKLKCNKDEEKGKPPEDPSNSELLQQSGSR